MPMERKTPIAYPDGVYEFAGRDRPNVLIIANLTQNGLTGQLSTSRTAFFIYFGEFYFDVSHNCFSCLISKNMPSIVIVYFWHNYPY